MKRPIEPVAIDQAGGAMGGAAKFAGELREYLGKTQHSDVTLLGKDRRVTPKWLLQREVQARKADRRIALNNVGFGNPRGQNITLLRNALHFATTAELSSLGFVMPRSMILQTRIVRAAARQSDVLVVPSSAMAERVQHVLPSVGSRIVVRHHPVTPAVWANTPPVHKTDILVPILNAPYKRLDRHIADLLAASRGLFDDRVHVVVTADAKDFAGRLDSDCRRVEFVGRLQGDRLDRLWRHCGAVYFPTQLESFGYPMAESRVNGRSVIALNSPQNREIAANSLRGFVIGDPGSLRNAIERAVLDPARSDPEPFDPCDYFDWLLGGAER